MSIRFLQITETEAIGLAAKIDEVYTPGYDSLPKFHFYKDDYTPEEELSVVELTELEADGLTPIDPTKPMFPKKPK